MEELYLDNSATTRVRPEVAEKVLELMTVRYGNPSSLHRVGLDAQLALDEARSQVGDSIGAPAGQVIFTSGGTESNNLALFGGAYAKRRRGNTIVAMAFEHSSVLEPLRQLEKEGFTLRLVPPRSDGNVDVSRILAAVDDNTILLSCMLVNSDTGAISPIARIVREARRKNRELLVHTDVCQALGKLPLTALRWDVDLLSACGHKIHAPKGVGCLYVKKGVRIVPGLYGGGQEQGLRPGTENVPLAAGFGLAAHLAISKLEENYERTLRQWREFSAKLEKMPGICINSPPDAAPYIMNISMPGYRSEVVLHFLESKGIYVSSGSACSRGKPSHVLTSMGLPLDRVDSALRISCGLEELPSGWIDRFCQALREARSLSTA